MTKFSGVTAEQFVHTPLAEELVVVVVVVVAPDVPDVDDDVDVVVDADVVEFEVPEPLLLQAVPETPNRTVIKIDKLTVFLFPLNI